MNGRTPGLWRAARFTGGERALHTHEKKAARRPKTLVIILLIAAAIILAAVAAYFAWEQAPAPAKVSGVPVAAQAEADVEADEAEAALPTPSPTPILESGVAPDTARQDGVYTILLVGEDLWTGHTDTILVGKLDTNVHKLDFVSIPRDTLLNMDGDNRKINSICLQAAQLEKDPMTELKSKVKDIIGFEVDCYAKLDLSAFIELVDAVGGVDVTLDEPLFYDDVWQDMYIDIPAGENHLTGKEAMALVRYRAGYASADIGRIDAQHKFLKDCARQFISLGNIPNLGKVIDILEEKLDTDLSVRNIAFFIRQTLMCSSDDINFYTMPIAPKTLGGQSYAVIVLYDWVKMINAYINPFTTEITTADLNVMYNEIFGYGCTRETQGAWYYVGAAEADMAAAAAQYGYGY